MKGNDMKSLRWQILLGLGLLGLSAIIYSTHYLVFHDAHHIWIYMLGDIAFVPIEVLLVTLIIHQLLTAREKKAKIQKLNMVIGTFFSETGSAILKTFSRFDPNIEEITKKLILKADWTHQNFLKAAKSIKAHHFKMTIKNADMDDLKSFLLGKHDFLLSLLNNPNLLEHDSFTDMLWAVFHLTEELSYRTDVTELEESDYNHLCGDIERAYRRTAIQWINYMQHLKNSYPYLFSLAMRTNPFNPHACVTVK